MGRHFDEDGDGIADQIETNTGGQPARTAGEQDHSDPWAFAGEDADPPTETGRPPQ